MKEEWKDIKGYENYYQISNLGRIKSSIKINNIPFSNISNCCRKNVHTAGGYIWKYAR